MVVVVGATVALIGGVIGRLGSGRGGWNADNLVSEESVRFIRKGFAGGGLRIGTVCDIPGAEGEGALCVEDEVVIVVVVYKVVAVEVGVSVIAERASSSI